MDELIFRSLKGGTSEAEEERLRSWRRASPENEGYYRDLLRLLELAGSAMRDEAVPPPPPMAKLMARPRRTMGAASGSRWNRAGWVWGGGAAMAATVAAIALGILAPESGSQPEFSLGAGEFVTGASETATVVLGDGTVVRLAPESHLRIPGEIGSREVFLDGRAYFAVAKQERFPFRVRTQAGEAVVLGTQFEIQTQGDDLRLVVLKGRVALGTGANRVEVGAGEMSLVADGTTTAPAKVEDVKPLVAWLERFIVFQSTPLREVARELESEYGVRVEVRDSALVGQTITGWYSDRSFEEVLTIICGVLQAHCSIQDGVARIER